MSFNRISNPHVPRHDFIPRSQRETISDEKGQEVLQKVDLAAKETLSFITPPRTPERNVIEISAEELARLRYAQASMKTETSDGLSLEELTQKMLKEGYDSRHAINVVEMSPSKYDSPEKKRVAFDTRRTSAARAAAKHYLGAEFSATIKLHKKDEPAAKEYEGLRHLTFENKKIPEWIRIIWIEAWEKWHNDDLLADNNIIKGTWGHLIKLRMAMSTDPVRSELAIGHSGFKLSPVRRKTATRRRTTSINFEKKGFKRRLPHKEMKPRNQTKAQKNHSDTVRGSIRSGPDKRKHGEEPKSKR